MRTPYRTAATPTARAAGRRALSGVAIACAVMWVASVARLVVASIRDEPFGVDVALASLLGAAPTAALLSRSARDAMREDVGADAAPRARNTGRMG